MNKLTPEEEYVIINRGTEKPYSGKFCNFKEEGIFICKKCGCALYKSEHKFDSNCGWPSFDDEINGAISKTKDKDGIRTEISCSVCNAHLGHIFEGERFTNKNIRHCVNSISMDFIPLQDSYTKFEQAVFAGGCFWGVEYWLKNEKGIINCISGYTGGYVENPTYKDICKGTTGHAEAVQVIYDKKQNSFENLAKLFFEIHDPTQLNRQGPDVGEQYRSAIFYVSDEQRNIAENLINILKEKGHNVVTKLEPLTKFWSAEDYHQNYYEKKNQKPYCHIRQARF